MTQLLATMTQLLQQLVSSQNAHLPAVQSSNFKALDERHFRRLQKFENKQEAWKEWRTHFLTSVRESSPITAEVMERAELADVAITADEVLKANNAYQEALDLQHVIHARLVALTTGVSFTIVESSAGSGLEAWRLLAQKYNPRTHSRCVQLVNSIINYKIHRIDDVLTGLVRWESMVAMLARDHKEVLSEKMQVALLVKILPNTLQERVNEHLDRLVTYKDVHAKIVNLIQSSSKYSASDAMDCSGVDEYYEDSYEEADVNALARDQCARCGGVGHYAKDCSTPSAKGKSKGKGKAQRSDETAYGGKGNLFCSHCKRPGHNKETCWDLYPDMKRKGGKGGKAGKNRKVAGLDEEQTEDEDVRGLIELSALDCLPCAPNEAFFENSDDVGCCGVSCDQANACGTSDGAVRAASGTSDSATRGKLTGGASDGASRNKNAGNSIGIFPETFHHVPKVVKICKDFVSSTPCSFSQKSYFNILEDPEEELAIQAVNEQDDENEDETPWTEVVPKGKSAAARNGSVVRAVSKVDHATEVNVVDNGTKKSLRRAGSGKITIDSGAGESVCPIDMVPEEPLHKTNKIGTHYRAAGGQKLVNKGEKRIKFKAGSKIGKLNFQAINEVKKPLASAAKIANKGNVIVLDAEGCDSYIMNKSTKQRIPIHQENNVYVMNVDFMTDSGDFSEPPFQRQV